MVQSVELLLAPDDERRVLEVWQALLGAGLPSQARHAAPSNRPHVTLVAVAEVPAEAEPRLGPAVSGLLPAPGRWGDVHLFGRGAWVLVRLVEPSAEMRALQAATASVCAVPPDHLTSPQHWVPHVTLARRVSAEDLDRCLEIVATHEGGTGAGGPVTATAVRRWDGAARREWLVGTAPAQA